jgi:hypothetical protein
MLALPLAVVLAEFVLVAGPAHPYEHDMIAATATARANL